MTANSSTISTIVINSVPIAVRDTAEADLPVVLALHSLFLDGRMFEEFTAAARGVFRVVSPDFRGQGLSGMVDADIVDMDTHAADIEQLIERLGLQDINLLAQSMGGDVGLRVVHRNPELFSSVALIGSSARSEPGEKHASLDAWVETITAEGFTGETLEETLRIMFGTTTRSNPSQAENMAMWRSWIAEAGRNLAPQLAGVNARGSLLEVLPEITVPTLVICGEEDVARPPAWSEEIADRMPRAELVVMAGIGHSPILEDPGTVIPHLLAFFAQSQ
ncbi:alpha/beta fold hydrolase [Arthrobacter sp. R-11]|uniref:alpha/beta fold hydrolase n=1 Tax=Arthrobacter sp. R-11 TaxID=3404053 RepID=UPI003CF0ECE9